MELVISINKEYLLPENTDLEIIVEKNVTATLIEKNNTDRKINLKLNDNSNINYLSVDLSRNSNKEINIAANCNLNMTTSNFNGGNKNTTVYMNEENSIFNLKSIIMMKGEADNEVINVYHKNKNTESKIENYITSNNANISVDVIGKIEKGMSNSNCVQKSRGIILTDNARIKVMPVLLIDEYDVSANHGAAIGKIDDEGLYYLMSRGISRKDAEMLIIKGFLNPILNELESEEIKEELINLSDQRL